MVFLDQDAVVEPGSVVDAAADTHGVFFQLPHAGGGLAGIDDTRPGSGHRRDIARGEGGDAAQALEQVQGHPFAHQQFGRTAAYRGDQCAFRGQCSLRQAGDKLHIGIKAFENLFGDEQPGKSHLLFGDQAGRSPAISGDQRLRGDVAGMDVFEQGLFYEIVE